MIRDFKSNEPSETEHLSGFQWVPAITSGVIAGVIVLVMPRGNPWSALTFFSPMILGRIVPSDFDLSLFGTITIHLAGSIVYGILISLGAARVTGLRALLIGGAVGLALYGVNLAIVTAWLRELSGNEVSVAITHAVFGIIAGGAYRGLLRRHAVDHRVNL